MSPDLFFFDLFFLTSFLPSRSFLLGPSVRRSKCCEQADGEEEEEEEEEEEDGEEEEEQGASIASRIAKRFQLLLRKCDATRVIERAVVRQRHLHGCEHDSICCHHLHVEPAIAGPVEGKQLPATPATAGRAAIL